VIEGMTSESKTRRIVRRIGVVKSDRMDKTIVVRVDRRIMHPIYKKIIKRHTTLVAHDEKNEAHEGDRVQLAFCRPLSKTKRWRLEQVLEPAPTRARERGA
jgi:small subunit ribosomal protein S17